MSETILRRLLSQDVIHQIRSKGKEKDDPSLIIYQQGKPVDYFVLILEGRVEVTVGREGLLFESGPFTYFGTQALVQNVSVGEYLIQNSVIQCLIMIFISSISRLTATDKGFATVAEHGRDVASYIRARLHGEGSH